MALRTRLREPGLHVVRLRCALEIFQVATHAGGIRAGQVVIAIHVTLCALHRGMRSGQRETSGRVVKIRTHPRRCVMALRTRLREPGLHMVRLRCALEIFQVATDASRICAGQVVVAIHVTLCALDRGMGSGEREACRRVVESCVIPTRRVVTLRTGLRESRLHVVRLRCALEIFQVATRAGGIRAGQVVIAIHVALCALHRGVRSGQREARRRVIESCVIPVRGVVTLRAGLRESRLYVVGIRGALEVLQVAAGASRVRAGQVVVAVYVALQALHRGVRSGQGETRRRVIKRRVVPVRRGMALLASRRESRLHVIRIGRAIEVLHVARPAICRRAHKLPVNVALRAPHIHVAPGQREFGERIVIERRHIPCT